MGQFLYLQQRPAGTTLFSVPVCVLLPTKHKKQKYPWRQRHHFKMITSSCAGRQAHVSAIRAKLANNNNSGNKSVTAELLRCVTLVCQVEDARENDA